MAPDPWITVVSGSARCGTSMTMRMLAMGGMPCVGQKRFAEVPQVDGVQEWLRNCAGMAVKNMEPTRYVPPEGPEYRVIWLDRDMREQAKSTLKMARALGENAHRSVVSDIERQIREVRRPSLDAWAAVGAKLLVLRFEHFLRDYPRGARDCARQIEKFVGVTLDIDAMAAAVVKRKPGCLPYLLETRPMGAP